MTESLAAVAFYAGLLALVVGLVRVVRASVERRRRDLLGSAAIVVGLACLAIAVAIFLRSPKNVLPF